MRRTLRIINCAAPRQMLVRDRIRALLDAELVRQKQHFGVSNSGQREEFEVREFDQLSQRVAEIDGVHEAAIHFAGVFDPAFVQPFLVLVEGGAGDVEGEVMEIADPFRVGGGVGLWSLRVKTVISRPSPRSK